MADWNGARTGDTSPQEYYTSPDLASRVALIAKEHSEGPYVELGVGGGALFKRLPASKQGVELLTPHRNKQLPNVQYGTNALTWYPRGSVRTVVMNPPFASQIAFFNHAASFAGVRTIVWIAGLNIRLWSQEDMLDPYWHLSKEWVVPPEMSLFDTTAGKKRVRTVVQVWQRRSTERELWNLRPFDRRCKNQEEPPSNATILRKTGSPARVGESGRANERGCLEGIGKSVFGTLRQKDGTAVAIRLCEKEGKQWRRLFADGDVRHLLAFRTHSPSLASLTMPVIGAMLQNAKRLRCPFEFLDGKRRAEQQW